MSSNFKMLRFNNCKPVLSFDLLVVQLTISQVLIEALWGRNHAATYSLITPLFMIERGPVDRTVNDITSCVGNSLAGLN